MDLAKISAMLLSALTRINEQCLTGRRTPRYKLQILDDLASSIAVASRFPRCHCREEDGDSEEDDDTDSQEEEDTLSEDLDLVEDEAAEADDDEEEEPAEKSEKEEEEEEKQPPPMKRLRKNL